MINKKDIQKLIDGHTRAFTIEHICQELAELTVAVSKYEIKREELLSKGMDPDTIRGLCEYEIACIAEELADVEIMLPMAREVYQISDKYCEYVVSEKMKENLQRVNA